MQINQALETHDIISVRHVLKVGHTILTRTMKKVTVKDTRSQVVKSTVTDLVRQIDNQSVGTRSISELGNSYFKQITNLDENGLEEFDAKWDNLWTPTIKGLESDYSGVLKRITQHEVCLTMTTN